jgi:hypothetical protein
MLMSPGRRPKGSFESHGQSSPAARNSKPMMISRRDIVASGSAFAPWRRKRLQIRAARQIEFLRRQGAEKPVRSKELLRSGPAMRR